MKEGRKRGENVSSSPCSWPSSDWCSSRLKPVEWEALLSLFLSPQVVARHPGNAAFPVPCVVFFIISFFPFFSGFSILPHRKKKENLAKENLHFRLWNSIQSKIIRFATKSKKTQWGKCCFDDRNIPVVAQGCQVLKINLSLRALLL